MKYRVAAIICFLSGTLILGKAVLIQYPKRSTVHALQQTDVQKHIQSCLPETILIEAHTLEQSIELLKYAQLLKAHNKTVVCKVPEDAHTLLSWCPYIDQVCPVQSQCQYDIKVSMQELASYTTVSKNTADQQQPLLVIDEAMLALWQATFMTDDHFKIGVCCSSSYDYHLPEKDDVSIRTLIPLAAVKYANLYSFDDLDAYNIPETINLFHFDKQIKQTLANITTLIYHMDLMITTQPLLAYIAETLGKRAWLIVPAHTHKQEIEQKHPHVTVFVKSTQDELLCALLHQLVYLICKPSAQIVTAEIAIGELIDKMTILEIKTERIQDEEKLYNIYTELDSLQKTFDQWIDIHPELETLIAQLKAANEALWVTEDLIRDKEREKLFDNEFIQLARKVYLQNDERCRIKRKINELLGSRLVEEKSYKPY